MRARQILFAVTISLLRGKLSLGPRLHKSILDKIFLSHITSMEFSKTALKQTYKHNANFKRGVIIILIFLVFFTFILGIVLGSTNIPFIDVFKALFSGGTENNALIIRNVRLPRVLAAVIAGAGLAASGCVMQNVLKNDMASPSTLGVGNASVFGANLAIIGLGVGSSEEVSGEIYISNPYAVSSFAFLFALICILLILFLSRIKHFSNESIVLSGVALSTIFSAGTLFLQFFSDETSLSSAVFWSFGDLGRIDIVGPQLYIMLGVVLMAIIYFMLNQWNYNAIASGKDLARSLGIKVEQVSIVSLLLASLITAVSVAFLGVIGFVGLICSHIMRIFVKDDFRYLLPASCLFGALLLLVSDIISRVLMPGVALPVGGITSLLGGPMFIYLLLMKRERR